MTLKWWGKCLLLIGLLSTQVQAQEVPAREPITVTWFLGLGAGSNEEQLKAEKKVVEDFNNSQTAIRLELICGCGGAMGTDVFATLVAAGHPPDIVGPIGFNMASRFAENWLDLQPLVDKTEYDLSQFAPNTIDAYRSNGELLSIPFALFPGVLYYNADLFDAAGLNYPPTIPGEPYVMPDGHQVPWDYDTVITVAQLLTLDDKGHTANDPDFDADHIIQFGFDHQWDNLRSDFHTFGPASALDANGQFTIPDHWRAQAHWMWDAIWTYHFMPTADHTSIVPYSTLFSSGYTAMDRSMLWFTCCLEESLMRWDIAIQPAYEGHIYAPMDMDSFYIHKYTTHPDEAFTALQYLLGASAQDLLKVYSAFPARPALQAQALALRAEQFPQVQNWDVVLASIPLAPVPNHETWLIPFQEGQGRLSDFLIMMRGAEGGSLDLDVELDRLQADLQAIADAKAKAR